MKRYIYRAGAAALGGRLLRPTPELLEIQAASTLPPDGGYGSARVERYRFRDLVSFDLATSVVVGSTSDEGGRRIHNTMTTVTLEGLDVMGVVTADRVVARLASEQNDDDAELPIGPVGSHFVNLKVAGEPVEATPHAGLASPGHFEELRQRCAKSRTPVMDPEGKAYDFGNPLGARSQHGAGAPSAVFEERLILTSYFESPPKHPLACAQAACRIDVPAFGRVHIGELLITRNSRRLTMLRLEMGSPVEGELSVGVVESNGHTFP